MLEENWNAVQVFKRCRQEFIAGMAGAHALGITAQEVAAAMRLVGVLRREWAEVSEQVQEMGRIAAEVLNARHA